MKGESMPLTSRIVVPLVAVAVFVAVDWFTSGASWSLVLSLTEGRSPLFRVLTTGVAHYFVPMILVPMTVTAVLVRPANTLRMLGLSRGAAAGLGFAFVATLPLGAVFAAIAPASDMETLLVRWLGYCLFPGIAEEVLFRAFLFGLLVRVAGWRFLPAATLGAVIFGIGHLYQGESPAEAAGVFAITLAAGLWWAWLYVRWDFNLYVPIGFHVFMNSWFNVFDVSETARLPMAGEVTRAAVVVASVIATLLLKRKRPR